VQSAEDRQRRKDEAEIRIREAEAYNKEKRNKILDGQYISREQVWQELAGRAVAMNTGLKSAMRAAALDLALTVAGDQGKTDLLIRELEKMIDAASNEYARELRFEVDMGAPEEDENEDTEEGIQCQEGFEHV
jgi:hypothetical protein